MEVLQIEVAFFTRYSLLVSFYSLLFCSLVFTRCSFARYSLVSTRYSLLFYSLLVAPLLVTRCFFTRYPLRFYSLLVASSLVTRYSLCFSR